MKEQICYNRSVILKVLRDIESIVVSLDRLGSSKVDMEPEDAHKMLSDFITEWHVLPKLARARALLSEPFSTELGPDDMDELERAMQDVPYWRDSQRLPPRKPRVNENLEGEAGKESVIIHLRWPYNVSKIIPIDLLKPYETLEKAIAASLAAVQAGGFDSFDIEGDDYQIYLYGPDADRLFDAVERLLRQFPTAEGGWVEKVYGDPYESGVLKIRADL